ncbi:unnamed protein product, partial [Symbiodinium microadriaticum]
MLSTKLSKICLVLIPILQSLRPEIAEHGWSNSSIECQVCVTAMEMRAQSRQYGIYDIRNDALRFCAGLFTMIEEHIDSDLSGVGVELELNRAAEKALRHPKVETICQTALTGDVSTETADRELVNQEKAQTPVTWGGSIPERCSLLVVSKVEAEILGCCAQSCGWDGKMQTCRYWPFFNQEEQDGWNERCCSEDTILRMSSREVMCNSVKPEAEREKLEERDPPQAVAPQDAQLVSQNFKESSLLQTAKLQDKETSG